MPFLFGRRRQRTDGHIRLPRTQKACSVYQQTLFSPEAQRTKHVKWGRCLQQAEPTRIHQHNSALTEPVNRGNPLGCRAVCYLGRSLSKLSLKWLLRKRSRASIHSSRHSFRVIGEELPHTKGIDLSPTVHRKLFCFWPSPSHSFAEIPLQVVCFVARLCGSQAHLWRHRGPQWLRSAMWLRSVHPNGRAKLLLYSFAF